MDLDNDDFEQSDQEEMVKQEIKDAIETEAVETEPLIKLDEAVENNLVKSGAVLREGLQERKKKMIELAKEDQTCAYCLESCTMDLEQKKTFDQIFECIVVKHSENSEEVFNANSGLEDMRPDCIDKMGSLIGLNDSKSLVGLFDSHFDNEENPSHLIVRFLTVFSCLEDKHIRTLCSGFRPANTRSPNYVMMCRQYLFETVLHVFKDDSEDTYTSDGSDYKKKLKETKQMMTNFLSTDVTQLFAKIEELAKFAEGELNAKREEVQQKSQPFSPVTAGG